MRRVAIIAAMPAELKPLTSGWRHERSNGVDLWRWSFDGGEWIAACAGAGVERAAKAFAEVEKSGELDSVISTGWAGALREELVAGQAYDVSCVIDAQTGERFLTQIAGIFVGRPPNETQVLRLRCAPLRMTEYGDNPELWLITNAKVADAAEKQRLASTYQAALVDMEAAAIARLARMRGIPFYCIKGISDGYSDQLTDFNRFISTDGQFQLLRFAFFALLRPWHWPSLIRMGENSSKAARSIAASVLDLLDERGNIRKLNGYPKHQR
jgi:adenosylhomocysteine nucleosidase